MAELDLSEVAALIDGIYQREPALTAAGLKSIAPALRFQEELCQSEEELNEDRQLFIRNLKTHVVGDEVFCQDFKRLRDEAARRYKETGNIWDSQITEFRRRETKLGFTDGAGLRARS